MEAIKITIDGARFSTLEEFYDEIDRLLTKDLTWKTGHNMSAFHDLLRGGFGVHEYGEKIAFTWTHAAKSRQDFGYEATVGYWERFLQRCHPTNRGWVQKNIRAAQNGEGPTLFELPVNEILDKEDDYDHSLSLDDET